MSENPASQIQPPEPPSISRREVILWESVELRPSSPAAKLCEGPELEELSPVEWIKEEPGFVLAASDRTGEERGSILSVEWSEEEGEQIVVRKKSEKERIVELEREITKILNEYQEALAEQTRQTRAAEEKLRQTKELLATKSAELSGAHAFLSATDRLSEVEVLGIVRDLNENIYQVAVNLTDEWEKLTSRATGRMDIDPPVRYEARSLVKRAVSRDPAGLAFLLQSCLCSQAVKTTSSWSHRRELSILESVYNGISSSEVQAISARWRLLTHKHLPKSSPRPGPLVQKLASVLEETGLFSSSEGSIEFVQAVTLRGIETIVHLSQRLESVFMVEVTSGDISLLFEAPGAAFDGARMINEFGSNNSSPLGGFDRIAGTTEVGVGKSVSSRAGKSRHTKVLSKSKVVLEKDVI